MAVFAVSYFLALHVDISSLPHATDRYIVMFIKGYFVKRAQPLSTEVDTKTKCVSYFLYSILIGHPLP